VTFRFLPLPCRTVFQNESRKTTYQGQRYSLFRKKIFFLSYFYRKRGYDGVFYWKTPSVSFNFSIFAQIIEGIRATEPPFIPSTVVLVSGQFQTRNVQTRFFEKNEKEPKKNGKRTEKERNCLGW